MTEDESRLLGAGATGLAAAGIAAAGLDGHSRLRLTAAAAWRSERHGLYDHGTLHRHEGQRLRRRVPGGLHPPAQGRSDVRGGRDALHPSRRVHRLRRVRAGVPGGGDLRARRNARQVEALRARRTRSSIRSKRLAAAASPSSAGCASCSTVPAGYPDGTASSICNRQRFSRRFNRSARRAFAAAARPGPPRALQQQRRHRPVPACLVDASRTSETRGCVNCRAPVSVCLPRRPRLSTSIDVVNAAFTPRAQDDQVADRDWVCRNCRSSDGGRHDRHARVAERRDGAGHVDQCITVPPRMKPKRVRRRWAGRRGRFRSADAEGRLGAHDVPACTQQGRGCPDRLPRPVVVNRHSAIVN